jgi:hypothetical protein
LFHAHFGDPHFQRLECLRRLFVFGLGHAQSAHGRFVSGMRFANLLRAAAGRDLDVALILFEKQVGALARGLKIFQLLPVGFQTAECFRNVRQHGRGQRCERFAQSV